MLRSRPPFIVSAEDVEETTSPYPGSDETLSYGRAIGRAAGLLKIGLHLERVPPGHRTSWPHAEQKEEEFVFVLHGTIDAWVDGQIYSMTAGDLAAFPAGTGICHTFINNSEDDAVLLVGGERSRSDNRLYYPLHPQRRKDLRWSEWWEDIPIRHQGPHDAVPDRKKQDP